jgi:2-dehydro-3-deoxyphosphooctonate aldolase (KDO 8-P synthase)
MGGGAPLFLIAGPCVIETQEHLFHLADVLKQLTAKLGIPFIFKTSYDKANRLSIGSYRGPGLEKGLAILTRLKKEIGVKILSDIHNLHEVGPASEVLDCLQIPALLCRQTDLVLAVAKTGKVINIKKGQFMAPWDMQHIIKKVESGGNNRILVTERGTSFGYNMLVSDMRCIPIMQSFGYPVVFDASHSVQIPGGQGGASAGMREMIPILAQAAVASGADGIFIEVHDSPDHAPSDSQNMLRLDDLEDLLKRLKSIHRAVS